MIETEALKNLQTIPGVGKEISKDLYGLGFSEVRDLRGKNPEKIYEALNKKIGYKTDPCVLYTFRCAVYFASEEKPRPELLKWWNWKDRLTSYEER